MYNLRIFNVQEKIDVKEIVFQHFMLKSFMI